MNHSPGRRGLVHASGLGRTISRACTAGAGASWRARLRLAEFRADKTIRAIVHRAKSILAADHTFFSVDSKHERQKGPEIHERLARVFVEQALEREPGQILTLTNAYLVFCEYLRTKGMEPVKRSLFKSMFAPLVRECFDLGLRNDVIDPKSEKQTAGWKGLHVGLNDMAAKA